MRNVVALLVATLLAASALGANVEGYVYSIDGTPVAGATVTAYAPEGSAEQLARQEKRGARTAIATAKTEAGKFTLANLPEAIVDIDVRMEGFAPAAARTLADEVPVTITLTPAPMIDGRVIASRKPVANAYVVWLGANELEYTATTDDNGRYRVPDPRRWAREPRVFHPGHPPLLDSGRGGELGDLDLTPLQRPQEPRATGNASVTGTVRLGTKPLAGAPIVVQSGGERYFPPVRVVTDAKGRYSVSGLPAAMTYIGAGEGLEPRIRTQGGAIAATASALSADLQREKSASVDLTFLRAPMVTGRVTDIDDKPVAAANVQLVLAGRSSFDFGREYSTHTLADGRYAIAMPPFQATETVNVAVTPRHHSTVRSKSFSAGSGDQRVDIKLPRFSALTLRVIDPEKKPVANALVAFAASEDLFNFSDARILLNEPFVARALRTNEAGETVVHVAPGMYDFAATATGFQVASVSQRTIGRSMTLDLPLEQAYAIRGRVHRNNAGVSNVEVRILGGERMFREYNATTGADGTFAIEGLAREKYRVAFQKHDELIQKIVEVDAPATVDLPLPPAGLLRGRVLDAATREPIRDFGYSIEAVEPLADARIGSPILQGAGSVPDGTFTATLSVAAYRVLASATGYTQSAPVEVRLNEREPTEVELLLDRGVSIAGRVLDENGSPVVDAQVFANSSDADRRAKRAAPRVAPGNARSAEDGSFTISGLEPGPIALIARKEGYVPFRKAMEITSSTTVDVQLSRGLRIEGTVTRGGKPVSGAQIGATTAAVGGDHQPAISDGNGRFVLQGLIPARYTISAFHDELHTEVRDVDPATQRQISISLDPKPRGVIFGSVTGLPSGDAKVVRRIVFAQSDDRGAEAIIDEAGNYRIEDAPTGSGVRVQAQWETTSGGRTSAPVTLTVNPGQETRADLDLGSETTVRGRVSHEGRAVAGARVIFTTPMNLGGSAQTRADGTYEVALPSPGTYQIFAHADTMNAQPYQSLRAIRGGETVDIDLREQQIDGTVIDAETRLPIAGAVVTLVPETTLLDMLSGETITDARGQFRILTAAAGPHRALAWANGYAHATQSVTLGASASRQLTFELRRSGELRIRVIDARNNVPLEAHIVITTAEGGFLPVRPERAPDAETYVFSLADGTYRVQAIVHGYATKTVTVSAPGAVEIKMD